MFPKVCKNRYMPWIITEKTCRNAKNSSYSDQSVSIAVASRFSSSLLTTTSMIQDTKQRDKNSCLYYRPWSFSLEGLDCIRWSTLHAILAITQKLYSTSTYHTHRRCRITTKITLDSLFWTCRGPPSFNECVAVWKNFNQIIAFECFIMKIWLNTWMTRSSWRERRPISAKWSLVDSLSVRCSYTWGKSRCIKRVPI